MHREYFCFDGSERGVGDDRAEVSVCAGAGASGDAVGVNHAKAEERDSGDSGNARIERRKRLAARIVCTARATPGVCTKC